MRKIRVNLLDTETSWATRVAIAGRKQAVDLDISAVPPSEAADNFLLHLRNAPREPGESDRDWINRTIPNAAEGSAWIPSQIANDVRAVCTA